MESDRITVGNYDIACHSVNTLIIGSGAAALNAAVSLHSLGVTDIVVATQQIDGGTSRNAGSDKQTYYKLSLSGREPDSVYDMASDLFNGKCMHGDIALCEAQGSVRAFMRLVELGVQFPHDQYGSFAGYKTDHDPRSRATSAGPYTSRMMHEALLGEIRKRGIRILDNHHIVALLTSPGKSQVTGAVALDLNVKDHRKAFVLFNSVNIVLGTGGPAGIYAASVYPESQTGSTGMAFLAGATGQNLTESQFGIASTKFRWNLSGSYQQAIPRYISTDPSGNDEKEFLNSSFPDLKTLAGAIFLKGYQWPFDPRKIENHGSSLIDVLVDDEINGKGRRVFLDYRKNPSWFSGDIFSTDILDPVAKTYLLNCGATGSTPFGRLKAINPPSIELYRDHGIDLEHEMLEIAVCAQHNNGGLLGNIWWESDLKHLFPVGEVNGSHGVYRPGGAALNSGQAGSFRAAMYISRNYNYKPSPPDSFINDVKDGLQLQHILNLAGRWMASQGKTDLTMHFDEIRRRMSSAGGIRRSAGKAAEEFANAREMYEGLASGIGSGNVYELKECFRLMDHCLTHLVYLGAIRYYTGRGGRSRGSAIITDYPPGPEGLCSFDRDVEKNVIEVRYVDGNLEFKETPPRDIPEQDLWFEKVWKEYLMEMQRGIGQNFNNTNFET